MGSPTRHSPAFERLRSKDARASKLSRCPTAQSQDPPSLLPGDKEPQNPGKTKLKQK